MKIYMRSQFWKMSFSVLIICLLGLGQEVYSKSIIYSEIDSLVAKYIDPSAMINGTGTKENPLNVLSTFEANTVYLFKRGTTYSHSNVINVQAKGVTFGAYGIGTRPIIQQTANTDNIVGSGSITVQDLELINISGSAGQDGNGLNFSGATGYLIVTNCKIHGGFAAVRAFQSPGLDVKATNSEIYDCWSDGFFLFRTHSIEIGYCNVYNVNTSYPNYPSDGDNIHLDYTPEVWIHHNILDHSSMAGKFCLILAVDMGNAFTGNAIVEYNTLKRSKNIGGTLFYCNYAKGSNIIFRYNKLSDGSDGIDSQTADLKIYYNTFSNLNLILSLNYGISSNVKFYNNTISNCGALINGYGENVDFKNNIVHTITGTAMTGGSNITSDYNDYYNVASFVNGNTTKGSHDIVGDPLFTNLGGLDFTLQKGSPCFDQGTTVILPQPIVDLNGVTVPKGIAPDMGAFEYIPTDTQKPTAPTALAVSNISNTSFTIDWAASSDNIGVSGYSVYKDGVFVTTVTKTSANIACLTQGTTYLMTVKAKDSDNNFSTPDSLAVTTISSSDNQSPSIPAGVIATNITNTGFKLDWNSSTDNVGVAEYEVYLDGSLFVSVTNTSANINGLIPGNTYSVIIKAKDAVGNNSVQSIVLPVRTLELCSGSDGWSPTDFRSNQTGIFTVECDVVPHGQNMAGILGLSDGHATTYGNLACIVEFDLNNNVLARNGTVYSSVNPFLYTAGKAYHVIFNVNVGTKKYDASIKPVGGSETKIATQYAFRTTAPSSQLNTFIEEADQCHLTVSNLVVTSSSTLTPVINTNSIKIYPNPALGWVDIEVEEYSKVAILDSIGKIVLSKTIEQGKTRVTLKLKKGVYIISIYGNRNKGYSKKLIID